MLANPPHTTRQIMQPETTWLAKIEPMPVADFRMTLRTTRSSISVLWAMRCRRARGQYAGKKLSKQIYPEWRGGYYYAARSKTNPSGPLALFYVSRWSSPVTAAQFAGIYAHSLNQRYKKVTETGDPKEAVQKTPDTSDNAPAPLEGRHSWSTEDGTVVIEEKGDTVFITESLDDGTTATLEKEVFPATSAAAIAGSHGPRIESRVETAASAVHDASEPHWTTLGIAELTSSCRLCLPPTSRNAAIPNTVIFRTLNR
jgi:hypothetical protein